MPALPQYVLIKQEIRLLGVVLSYAQGKFYLYLAPRLKRSSNKVKHDMHRVGGCFPLKCVFKIIIGAVRSQAPLLTQRSAVWRLWVTYCVMA